MLAVLGHVSAGRWEMVSGPALPLEIGMIEDEEKREEVAGFLALATAELLLDAAMEQRARRLHEKGFGALDAIHVAAAEAGGCNVFLTTDDRMIKRARQHEADLKVRIANPLDWIMEYLADDSQTHDDQ